MLECITCEFWAFGAQIGIACHQLHATNAELEAAEKVQVTAGA